jgi:hypothetical protein
VSASRDRIGVALDVALIVLCSVLVMMDSSATNVLLFCIMWRTGMIYRRLS